ncbi:hypothetical protein FRC11_006075, partial [Ceratobasidium sp. 423]
GYSTDAARPLNLVTEQSQVCDPNIADRFAEVYRATGRFHNEALLREHIISTRKQQLGEQHPRTLATMSGLARVYREQRRLTEAKYLQEATLAAQKHVPGEEQPDTLETTHRLAWTLYLQCQYAEAKALLTTAVAAQKRILGDGHRDTLESMDDLAFIYEDQGQLADADALRLTVTMLIDACALMLLTTLPPLGTHRAYILPCSAYSSLMSAWLVVSLLTNWPHSHAAGSSTTSVRLHSPKT